MDSVRGKNGVVFPSRYNMGLPDAYWATRVNKKIRQTGVGRIFLTYLVAYQTNSRTMSRGMPAPFTFSMSAARVSRMLAFLAAYDCANS